MKEPEVILEDWSPVCDIQAFVEKTDKNYYFYLWFGAGKENAKMKSCWICNTQKAPKEVDVKAMQNGEAPMMPARNVAHDLNGITIDDNALEIVWFEEGDAAALLCHGEVICVIPGWSGYNNFWGYSKYAKGMGDYAWEYESAKAVMDERVRRSKEFWDYCDTDNYWKDIQQEHIRALEDFFGKHERYYAIDGGKFPPKALVTGKQGGVNYGITLGVSLIAMPMVEQYFQDDAAEHRRIELGFATSEADSELCNTMYRIISSLSGMMWREYSFLAHGHTVPFSSLQGYGALLFLDAAKIHGMEKPVYRRFRGDAIHLLWVVPITGEDYQFVMENSVDKWLEKQNEREKAHIFRRSL